MKTFNEVVDEAMVQVAGKSKPSGAQANFLSYVLLTAKISVIILN